MQEVKEIIRTLNLTITWQGLRIKQIWALTSDLSGDDCKLCMVGIPRTYDIFHQKRA
uniref:Uncharacterized protein n=1 Tax=Rhizophora mucronata TaxID=61149 RepID=A0A2P2M3F8_RHIMU